MITELSWNRFESLTDIQVRHGKIPTSVLQGPFLAPVPKLGRRRGRNAIVAYFRCDLKHIKSKTTKTLWSHVFFDVAFMSVQVHAALYDSRTRPVRLASGRLDQQRNVPYARVSTVDLLL